MPDLTLFDAGMIGFLAGVVFVLGLLSLIYRDADPEPRDLYGARWPIPESEINAGCDPEKRTTPDPARIDGYVGHFAGPHIDGSALLVVHPDSPQAGKPPYVRPITIHDTPKKGQ